MPKLTQLRPRYCHHVKSGKGRVSIDGKYRYLPGAYDSPESWQAYWAVIAERERAGALQAKAGPTRGRPPRAKPEPVAVVAPTLLSIAELIERYREHCLVYYRHPDGEQTGEAESIRFAVRPLLDLFPETIVNEFTPVHLKRVRDDMIRRDWSRRFINDCIRRIKTMFTWGVEDGLVKPETAGAIRMVKALREGRSHAREKPEVEAVQMEVIEAVLPHLSPTCSDMVRLMIHCGCRPGELKHIMVEAIDRSDPEMWTCPIVRHKTAWRSNEQRKFLRVLCFNATCQAILKRHILKCGGTGKIFRVSHSGLRTAIGRACKKIGVPRFGPNALRHTAATEVRKQRGLEGAQHLLGHKSISSTERYAELSLDKAKDAARAIG
jgi:integrase